MNNIIDKLLISFLVPSILFLIFLVLLADPLLGDAFDLNQAGSLKTLYDNASLLGAGLIISYIFNTSLSVLFNRLMVGIYLKNFVRKILLKRICQIKHPSSCDCSEMLFPDMLTENHQQLIKEMGKKIGVATPDPYILYSLMRMKIQTAPETSVRETYDYYNRLVQLNRSTILPLLGIAILCIINGLGIWGLGFGKALLLGGALLAMCMIQIFHYLQRFRWRIHFLIDYFMTREPPGLPAPQQPATGPAV